MALNPNAQRSFKMMFFILGGMALFLILLEPLVIFFGDVGIIIAISLLVIGSIVAYYNFYILEIKNTSYLVEQVKSRKIRNPIMLFFIKIDELRIRYKMHLISLITALVFITAIAAYAIYSIII